MPTTWAGPESMEISRPTAASSPPKRRCQKEYGKNDRRRPLGRGSVFLLSEATSAQRLHSERLKRAVRDSKRAHAFWITAINQCCGVFLPYADTR